MAAFGAPHVRRSSLGDDLEDLGSIFSVQNPPAGPVSNLVLRYDRNPHTTSMTGSITPPELQMPSEIPTTGWVVERTADKRHGKKRRLDEPQADQVATNRPRRAAQQAALLTIHTVATERDSVIRGRIGESSDEDEEDGKPRDRKGKKNERERARRQEVNDGFENLGTLLGVERRFKAEKALVLQAAIHEITRLRGLLSASTIHDGTSAGAAVGAGPIEGRTEYSAAAQAAVPLTRAAATLARGVIPPMLPTSYMLDAPFAWSGAGEHVYLASAASSSAAVRGAISLGGVGGIASPQSHPPIRESVARPGSVEISPGPSDMNRAGGGVSVEQFAGMNMLPRPGGYHHPQGSRHRSPRGVESGPGTLTPVLGMQAMQLSAAVGLPIRNDQYGAVVPLAGSAGNMDDAYVGLDFGLDFGLGLAMTDRQVGVSCLQF